MTNIYYSLNSLKKILKEENPSKIVLITSNNLKNKLQWAIKKIHNLSSRKVELIFIPDGEKAKNWNEAEKLLNKLFDHNLDRKSMIIALGGGAVSDIVGFASSIYLRGIKYINIPTTLLSQVDSAYGGKTAINFKNYKNQVGTFYNPHSVIVESNFLKTLKDEQIIDGLGEIIKYGFIRDGAILNLLKNKKLENIKNNNQLIESLIKKSIKIKQDYISKDFKDKNIRQMLNFGHTIGHALELKYKISHGRAVLYGMLKELEIGEKIGITKINLRNTLLELLGNLDIKLKNLKPDWNVILRDKKIVGDQIVLPVVKSEGISKLSKLKLSKLKILIKS